MYLLGGGSNLFQLDAYALSRFTHWNEPRIRGYFELAAYYVRVLTNRQQYIFLIGYVAIRKLFTRAG